MKKFWHILPIIICTLLMAAHLSRADLYILMFISLVVPFLLLWKSRIAAIIIQFSLVFFGLEWIWTLVHYASIRIENNEDWLRLAIILSVVAILNFATILIFRTKLMKGRYNLR